MRKWYLLWGALAALLPGAAGANPFVLPDGASQLGFTITSLVFDEFKDGQGNDIVLGSEFEQTSFIIAFDHGLSDELTLSLSLPWSEATRETTAPDDPGLFADNSGVSDARIGLKWALPSQSRLQFALLAGVKWPGEYEPDVINSPGDGNFDAELALSGGQQWERGTLSLDIGYRSRSGAPDDELFLKAEGSYLATTLLQLYAAVDWVDSQGGIGIDETTTVIWPFSATEEDFTRVTLGGIWSFSDRVSSYLAATQAIDGKSTAGGTEYALGLAFSF